MSQQNSEMSESSGDLEKKLCDAVFFSDLSYLDDILDREYVRINGNLGRLEWRVNEKSRGSPLHEAVYQNKPAMIKALVNGGIFVDCFQVKEIL